MQLQTHDAALSGGADRLAALQAAEIPQKDELCGCFWATMALRLAGLDVDQDALAEAAGTVVSRDGGHDDLPAGETGRRDYRLQLPITEEAKLAGTAPAGLVRAVDEVSGGVRAAIPIDGPWVPGSVAAVLALASAEQEAVAIANVATRHFWGSQPSAAQLLGYLAAGADDGPPPDWDVGHYVCLFGSIRGPGGTLVIVGDTYPSLGHGAVYLQPIERVATALERKGMNAGGIVLVVPSDRRDTVAAEAADAGLGIRAWDNGSPDARNG